MRKKGLRGIRWRKNPYYLRYGGYHFSLSRRFNKGRAYYDPTYGESFVIIKRK